MNDEPANTNARHLDAEPAETLFEAILEQVDLDAAAGYTPRVKPNHGLPETLRGQLADLSRCVGLLNAAARQGGLTALADDALAGGHNLAGTATATSGVASAADDEGPLIGEQIGRFRIVRELGRGGYGVVFLARDQELGREVALKLPRPEALVTDDLRRRFLREARAAGRLAHPHVLGVYDVGEDGGLCYLVAPFCRGPSLAHWLEQHTEPLPPRDAAQLVAALADGLEHAHQLGVLHRDIKPSNILLDVSAAERQSDAALANRALCSYVPKLTDFGLAKLLEAAEQDTRTGAMLGTPAYMAPEQAGGRPEPIGAAADVYALGAVLYELLTGRPPLVGESDAETLALIANTDPVPPRQIRRAVPRDLQAVALKCLEKNSLDRYASAGDLAKDLQRFLHGEPTVAKPANPVRRLLKWIRRRPAAAAGGIAAVGALLLIVFGGLWYSAQLARKRSRVVHHQYVRDMQDAFRARQHGDVDRAAALVAKYDAATLNAPLRNFEWYWLRSALGEQRLLLPSQHQEAYAVVFTADGSYLFSGGNDGVIRAWNMRNGALAFELRGHTSCVNQLALSPDGQSLASASCDKTVRIWNLASRKPGRVFSEHATEVRCLAFAPHAPLLAAGMLDSQLNVWNTEDASLATSLVLAARNEPVDTVAFSPDGRYLAAASGAANCVVWKTTSWERAHDCGIGVLTLLFAPDSQRLVLGTRSHEVLEWEFGNSNALRVLGRLPGEVHTLTALNHPGTFLAAGIDGSVHAIGQDGLRQRVFSGGMARVSSLAVSQDGALLAAASFDGNLRIWDLSRFDHVGPVPLQSPHTAWIGPETGDLIAWSLDTTLIHTMPTAAAPLATVTGSRQLISASAGGRYLWTGNNRSSVYTLRTLADLQPVAGIDERTDVVAASVSPDERTFAAVDPQGQVQIVDLPTGKETARFALQCEAPPESWQIGLNSDGSRLVIFEDGRFASYSLDTRDGSKAPLPSDLSFVAVAFMHPAASSFSPNGLRRVVPVGDNGVFLLTDSKRGEVIAELRHRDMLTPRAAWSPDGSRLIIVTRVESAAIFDSATGELLGDMDGGLEHVISNLVFSPDGESITAFCGGIEGSPGCWRIWNAPRTD